MSILLRTKLHTPSVRHNTVERAPLLHKLDALEDYAVTIVSAPAGFGKSTLLAQWLEKRQRSAAWYSCDAQDVDAQRVLRYVVGALSTVQPDRFQDIMPMIDSTPMDLDMVHAALVEALLELETTVILVIDDVHLIPDDVLTETLSPLVRHDIPLLRLVLLGRSDPALPLARLRAQGRLLDVRSADLRLDATETQELLRAAYGIPLADVDAKALATSTEGWMAGVVLAATRLRQSENHGDIIKALANGDQFVLDFLVQDVLSLLAESDAKDVLLLSLMDRFSAQLVTAMLGRDGEKFLADIVHRNLFVISLDEDGTWYRFHHLVADLFRRLARLRHPQDIDEVLTRAGVWSARHGYTDLAVQCAREASLLSSRCEIIAETWVDDLDDADASYVTNFLLDLDVEHRTSDIRLLIMSLSMSSNILRFDLVPEYISQLETVLKGDVDPAMRAMAMGTICHARAVEETGFRDYDRDLMYMAESVSWYQSISADEARRANIPQEAISVSITNNQINTIRTLTGSLRINEALARIDRLRSTEWDRLDTVFKAIIEQDTMRCHALAGRGFRALEARDRIRDIERTGKLVMSVPHELDYNTLCARIAFDLANIEETEGALGDIAALVERKPGLVRARLFNAFQIECRLAIHLGNADRARRASADMLALNMPALAEMYSELARLMEAATAYRFGPRALVDRWMDWVESDLLTTRNDKATNLLGRTYTLLFWFRLKAERNELGPYRHILHELYDVLLVQNLPRLRLEADDVFALEAEVAGRLSEAERARQTIAEERRSHGCLLPLLTPRDYVAPVESAITSTPPVTINELRTKTRELGLTSREIDALTLLARGFSNQRIADELYVSLATIKTHLYNLFQKLDVRSRSEAILKAKSMGLV